MRRKLSALIVFLCVLAFSSVPVFAETIVRSFDTKGSLQPGWVVELNKTNDTNVELATDSDLIYGLVIDPSDAPLTLQKQNQQVFVATSGTYPALVSSQNGTINNGDYLSLSSTDGIAAKATSHDAFILGRALEGFSAGKQTIVYANDGSALGRIMVQVAPGKNPLLKDSVGIPQPLRRVSESIAGKPVSALRIYTGLALFIISALTATLMLWSGIRNGMVAIGRNPLSRHSIMRGLAQVILAGAAVLIIGLLGVYLLLKL